MNFDLLLVLILSDCAYREPIIRGIRLPGMCSISNPDLIHLILRIVVDILLDVMHIGEAYHSVQ